MAASTHQPGRAELDPAGELLGKPVPGAEGQARDIAWLRERL